MPDTEKHGKMNEMAVSKNVRQAKFCKPPKKNMCNLHSWTTKTIYLEKWFPTRVCGFLGGGSEGFQEGHKGTIL